MYNVTQKAYENIRKAKINVIELEKFISTWTSTPMFTRDNPNSLVDFEICMTPEVRRQREAAKKTCELMKKILKKNQELFESDIYSDEWKNYIDYLDSIFEEGLKKAAKCSLQYLFDNTNTLNKNLEPFYKVSIFLDGDIIFKPPIDHRKSKNLMKLFEAVIEKIYSPSIDVRRMSNNDLSYFDAVCHDEKLESLLGLLIHNLKQGMNKASSITEELNRYADLWLKNIDEDLEDFSLHGPITDIEILVEEEHTDNIDFPSLEMQPPTEEEFKMEIAKFDQLYKRIDDIENIIEVESWLILDVTLFKESLLQTIKKWQSAYKKKMFEMKQLGTLRKIDDDGDL